MTITKILKLSDNNHNVMEVVFNTVTTETKIGGIDLSKNDLDKFASFIENAINLKVIKERKENSLIAKLTGKAKEKHAELVAVKDYQLTSKGVSYSPLF